MANPTVVSGRLVDAAAQDFSGLRIEASYTQVSGELTAPVRQAVQAEADGQFRFELPEVNDWKPPLVLEVPGASGRVLGCFATPADLQGIDLANIQIALVQDTEPTKVEPFDDPAAGGLARFTGRVINRRGESQLAGLLVVLWGAPPPEGSTVPPPYPLAVTETAAGGYFAGAWPSDVLTRAFARVAGGAPVDIALENSRLPRRIVLVVDEVAADGEASDTPPRAPTAEELAQQADVFAQDAGSCTSFTVPNRTVEEVVFHAVVRTTQPEIRGSGRPPPRPVPGVLIDRIAQLARMQPVIMDALAEPPAQPDFRLHSAPLLPASGAASTAIGQAVNRAMRLMSLPGAAAGAAGASGAALPRSVVSAVALASIGQRSEMLLAARDLKAEPLRLETSVLADLAREKGALTPARLLQAERTSLVRNFRFQVQDLAFLPVGRFELSADRQADWDNVPYAYQATTVAHGHLLSMKQVWRADGYSLGDVLYSLPLAPGQQKLVSILDWERRDEQRRTQHRITTEDLSANLTHDRDISDIVRTALHERMDAQSRANVSAVAAGIGGFIGPVVFGAAGGTSTASSSASQASSRQIAATALNSARDRTLQAASAVRGQRATVVQTARQGESVRAQTEAIANNNHCHAMTVEYFEVLRHLQVTQEIAHVQECLLVPFTISRFNDQKALRWRHVLGDMTIRFGGRPVYLRPLFDALERMVDGWQHVHYPTGRYADEQLLDLSGESRLRMSIPRPADTADDTFDAAAWAPYQEVLGVASPAGVLEIWTRYMGVALPRDRGAVWNTRLAPAIARRLIDNLEIELVGPNNTPLGTAALDATLVSPFRQNAELLASFRPTGSLPAVTRADVQLVRLRYRTGLSIPPQIEAMVQTGSMRYRTEHAARSLFEDYRLQNDLGSTDPVVVATPLDRFEKSNPRQTDRRQARVLIDILNERLEYMHRLIWLAMDPNRRYMFLDGVVAPDAGGRSIASVVENRLIGIVGNSLVMPVIPGLKLDPTYEFAGRTQAQLRDHYATNPPPPMRISVPTRGVFAEAVLGACNSCETIDDKRFWRWEDAPIPDSPTAIEALSTESRRQEPPSVAPTDFNSPLVRMQTVPTAPDPTGLSAALELLGTKDLFRNLTGLALNQENAAGALKGVMTAAQSFASQGAALAQQKFMSGQVDRNLDLIKKARDRKQITPEQAQTMTESMFRGALGERRPEAEPVTESPAVKRAMDRVLTSDSGEMRVTRPGGSVEIKTGSAAAKNGIDVAVDPPVSFVPQPTKNVCWAAVGTMMISWSKTASMTIDEALGTLGGSWLAKFKANQTLSAPQVRALAKAIGLQEEGPMSYSVEGLARLLEAHGPLWAFRNEDFDGNALVHAQIITAMRGDGSPEGTMVTLADPSKTDFHEVTFSEFAKGLEALDVVNIGLGIMHF